MSGDAQAAQAGPAESFQFKAEIQQLLNILVHSLYTEREIFLRELISNAADALNRIQFEMLTNRDVLDSGIELSIRVEVDPDARMLIISDSGVGMTREEIIQDLGTIAHSGARAFLQELEDEKRPSVELIGQFGVGFYSVFMVADRVRLVSRSYRPDADAVEWVSDGSSDYQLGPADKEARGTRIEIHLKEDAAEFLDTWRLEQIIRKHSDYVVHPIYVGEGQEPVNRQTALWRQPTSEVTEEQHGDFYRHLTLDAEAPLLHTHLVTDAPVSLRSVLYIPAKRDRGLLTSRTDYGLQLYIRNVLIQEYNKDLLPNHFRFVEGVVESEDLPLNISRETVQSSPAMRRIRRALSRKVLKELETLAREEPEQYSIFWREFGPFIKEGVAADPVAKGELTGLLRFRSSRSGENLVSLAEYAERMGDEQPAIYYILGEDLRSVALSPHLDYFEAHDIEVLYLVDPIDSFVAMALQDYEGTPLKNVDAEGLELPEDADSKEDSGDPVPEADLNRVIGRFVKVLGDQIAEVRESKVLRGSPCRLVSPEDAPLGEMSRVYRMLDQDFEAPKRILEINRTHPIITNLARLVTDSPDDSLIDPVIQQLFENQLLMEGLHPNPTDMIARIHQLLERATAEKGVS